MRRWTLRTDFLKAYACRRSRLFALLGQSLGLFGGLARHLKLLFLWGTSSHYDLEVEFVGKVLYTHGHSVSITIHDYSLLGQIQNCLQCFWHGGDSTQVVTEGVRDTYLQAFYFSLEAEDVVFHVAAVKAVLASSFRGRWPLGPGFLFMDSQR